jgi:hypothetical protein
VIAGFGVIAQQAQLGRISVLENEVEVTVTVQIKHRICTAILREV